MKTVYFNFEGQGGISLAAVKWLPKTAKIKASLLIVHGMAEHCLRYAEFAEYMTGRDWAVYAFDLRGHGRSINQAIPQGSFGPENGWFNAVEDIACFKKIVLQETDGLPFVALGHSLGSYLLRTLLSVDPYGLRGAVFSGAGYFRPLAGLLGGLIALRQVKKHGPDQPARFLDKVTFGGYNRRFKPEKTACDWLSRDQKKVADYCADPLCGFVCSHSFFRDMIAGLAWIHGQTALQQLPKSLPLLFFSGTEDPVGDYGKGVARVVRLYSRAGAEKVFARFFDGARHEILNETNRSEIYAEILACIEKHCA